MKRHALSTRLWHWLNLFCVVILFMSGLTISNAHPWLYWGEWGFAREQAWLAVPRFPDWMTIPGYYSLAAARSWHVLTAWPFALLLLFGWLAMLANRHFARDIATTRREWSPRAIAVDVKAHLRLDFDHSAGRYNFLQKLSYGLVLGIILPGMVLTGIAISPGMGPSFGWLIELMGGRQSARSLHFILAGALFAFFVVHVALVLLTGPLRLMRDMITGGEPSREQRDAA
jgi:thiosulfate reductase cytochrome b subunit